MKHLITLAALAVCCTALAQTPKPPSMLCIDDQCATTSPPQPGKKWHPGMGIKAGSYRGITAAEVTAATAMPNFGFIDSVIGWGQIEPKIGQYDWSMPDAALKQAKSVGRRLVFAISWKKFGKGLTDPSSVMPSDMMGGTAYGGGYTLVVKTENVIVAKVWRQDVMDQYIAMLKALATRYDGDPDVEMIWGSETTPSLVSPFPDDYSKSAMATQLKRMYAAAGKDFQHTNYMASINFLSGEVTGLIEAAYQAKLGLVDGDSIPSTPVYNLFRGLPATGEPPPIRDYRGLMAHYTIASQPTLGGKDSNGPPSNVIEWAKGYGVNYLSWVIYQPSPNSFADIQAAILASPTVAMACPAGATCDTR